MSQSALNFIKISAILIILASLSACNIGDNELTVGDKYSEELEDIIEEDDISRVSVYLLNTGYNGDVDYYQEHEKSSFTLEDNYIQVGNTYYSLNKLAKYERIYSQPDNYYFLELYFNIYL